MNFIGKRTKIAIRIKPVSFNNNENIAAKCENKTDKNPHIRIADNSKLAEGGIYYIVL